MDFKKNTHVSKTEQITKKTKRFIPSVLLSGLLIGSVGLNLALYSQNDSNLKQAKTKKVDTKTKTNELSNLVVDPQANYSKAITVATKFTDQLRLYSKTSKENYDYSNSGAADATGEQWKNMQKNKEEALNDLKAMSSTEVANRISSTRLDDLGMFDSNYKISVGTARNGIQDVSVNFDNGQNLLLKVEINNQKITDLYKWKGNK